MRQLRKDGPRIAVARQNLPLIEEVAFASAAQDPLHRVSVAVEVTGLDGGFAIGEGGRTIGAGVVANIIK